MRSGRPMCRVLMFTVWVVSHSHGAGGDGDEAVLRRVADAVVKQTTRCLVVCITGETFEDSRNLAPCRLVIRVGPPCSPRL